jgi:WD repeat-containing protein mio
MAGTLAALVPASANGPLSPELQQHYDRLIVRLEDTYFSVMLRHLAQNEWMEVLEEEALPLHERLAIAIQFLEDDGLTRYLRRISESAVAHGNLDGLMVTGLTTAGIDLLQAYVDRSGDVQTAAILGARVHPHRIRDARVEKWIDAYRDLLDGWKLFYHRSQFDVDHGQIVQAATAEAGRPPLELAPKQVLIRCSYCNKAISSPQGVVTINRVGRTFHY